MTNSNAMTNYFIIGGLLVVPFIGWLLVKEQFTGGDTDASLSLDKREALYGIDYQASGFNNPQAGGAKRRKTRSAKTKQKKTRKGLK
jgi:hypothetical protein